jgi:hypothetical protein
MTAQIAHRDAALEALNRLFIRALLLAGETGAAERACRLAAAGWSLLRHDYPREAERLNGALHALARHLPTTTTTTGVDHDREQDS